MGQHQPPQNNDDQLDPGRTQPSLTRPRDLDWRPPDHQSGESGTTQESLAERRERPAPRRRPPTEGAPTWVVGLGVGALLAVIVVLGLLFVASRPPAELQPTATISIVTPSPTNIPRQTFTALPQETAAPTPSDQEPIATAPPPDVIAVGGYVRVVSPSGLSFRDAASTEGVKLLVLDTGSMLMVIDGPQDSGGYTWWKLRKLDDNQEGWSASSSGEDIFLEPVSAP